MHSKRNQFVQYNVGDKSFSNDVDAFQYFTKNLNNKLELKFQFSLNEDWTQEPVESIEHYRQRVCEYIENKYHNITIAWSGGTDSETVVDAFRRRNTKNIRLLHATNHLAQFTKSRQWLHEHMRQQAMTKHADAVKDLGWQIQIGETWKTCTTNNFDNQLSDTSFGSWSADAFSETFNSWSSDSGEIKIKTKHNPKHNGCIIHGKEKPEINIEEGWWVAKYNSGMFELPFEFIEEDVETVYFFINDICPELPKKLAWAKAKEMEKIFIENNILVTQENATKTSLSSSNYYTRLNRAMGYKAISKFLDTSATKIWGWWFEQLDKEMKQLDKESQDKRIISNKYFDEVLVKTIDNRFLDFEAKHLHGIVTKSYPLFPIDDTLLSRLKEHENEQESSNKVKQPWEYKKK